MQSPLEGTCQVCAKARLQFLKTKQKTTAEKLRN